MVLRFAPLAADKDDCLMRIEALSSMLRIEVTWLAINLGGTAMPLAPKSEGRFLSSFRMR